MERSSFLDWVADYMPKLIVSVVDKANNKEVGAPYLFKKYTDKKYSVTGLWESVTEDNTNVSADFVAMDSSLPVKSLNRVATATGEIPKSGMELQLNEKQLTELNLLISMGNMAEVIRRVLQLVPRVINGVYEKQEDSFLQQLSTGQALFDTDNVGTGVRINLNLPESNRLYAYTAWGTAGYTPITDILKVLSEADAAGEPINKMFMTPATLQQIATSDEGKALFASFIGALEVKTTPTSRRIAQAISEEFGVVLEIVKKKVVVEIDGVKKRVSPFKEGQIAFYNGDVLGSVIHTKLAEEQTPVAGVNYEVADDYVLVSQFRTNRPSLAEFTTSQSRSVLVLSNIQSLFILDTTNTSA